MTRFFKVTLEGGSFSQQGVTYNYGDRLEIAESSELWETGLLDPGDVDIFANIGLVEEEATPPDPNAGLEIPDPAVDVVKTVVTAVTTAKKSKGG